jgi:hypothetical protein
MRAEVGRFCSADDNWKMKKNQRRVKKKKKKKKKKKTEYKPERKRVAVCEVQDNLVSIATTNTSNVNTSNIKHKSHHQTCKSNVRNTRSK